ncbi:M48 family metallopeptidase [Ralstonia insidiosa]|uniref:Peptidase M48 n=1 Tax=Ralstonia insidiosa TaxID=190721 RepID=A0A191ZTT0_9RALS|nr:M48 family metallopeptidase [Ralstonia insidiosa]ANJ71540.1 peptidase M48 [Ralstonia insidiosa]KAB0472138.1 M48 family metallopeptidase [Ralstonia insidiosa]MBY4908285.1 M48 family metallopeptidase [Ralstonia insidiosa]
MILATYFDGRTSRAQPVRLAVEAGEAALFDTDGTLLRRAALPTLRVSERVKHAPRLITFEDGAFCEIADPAEQAALNTLLQRTGHQEGLVVRAQNSWKLALGALIVTVLVLVIGYRYGLPWGAKVVANMVPQRVELQLGRGTLRALDERWLKPSKLPEAQQARIRARFAALRAPKATHTYNIVFRDAGSLGANAFALPGGDIIVTDALVKLVGEGDGLTGVLAHEAGHVEYRHGLRQLIQSSAIGATAALLFGDVSTILSGVPAAMLTLRYSRDYERDADHYAALLLQDNGLSVGAFADVLQALEDTHGGTRKAGGVKKSDTASDDDASAFFSSHPLTRERIDTLRRFDRTHGASGADAD